MTSIDDRIAETKRRREENPEEPSALIDRRIDSVKQERLGKARRNVGAADILPLTAQQAGEQHEIASRTGIPLRMVRAAPEEAKRADAAKELDRTFKNSIEPTKKWLGESPENAVIAKDEPEELDAVARGIQNFSRSQVGSAINQFTDDIENNFEIGQLQNELVELMEILREDPENFAQSGRLSAVRQELARRGQIAEAQDHNIAGMIVPTTVQMMPMMADSIVARTKLALPMGGGGFVAGGVTTFGPGAVPLGLAGLRAGSAIGGFDFSRNYEDQILYNSIIEENPELIGDPVVDLITGSAGVMSGSLEVWGQGVTIGIAAKMARPIMRRVAKNQLAKMTGKKLAYEGLRDVLRNATVEGGTEFSQEVVQILGEELAKAYFEELLDPQNHVLDRPSLLDALSPEFGTAMERAWDRTFTQENIDRAIEAGKAGVAGGTGFGTIASGVSTASQMSVLSDSKASLDSMDAIADDAQQLKIKDRSIASFTRLANAAKEGGDIDSVRIDVGRWKMFWQSENDGKLPPREAATQVGVDPDVYDEVDAAEDGDVVIPVEEFISRIATRPEVYEGLKDDIRFHPYQQSRTEINEFLATAEQRATEQQEQDAEVNAQEAAGLSALETITNAIETQISATGAAPDIARTQAKVSASMFVAQAQANDLDAIELFRERTLTITDARNERLTTQALDALAEGRELTPEMQAGLDATILGQPPIEAMAIQVRDPDTGEQKIFTGESHAEAFENAENEFGEDVLDQIFEQNIARAKEGVGGPDFFIQDGLFITDDGTILTREEAAATLLEDNKGFPTLVSSDRAASEDVDRLGLRAEGKLRPQGVPRESIEGLFKARNKRRGTVLGQPAISQGELATVDEEFVDWTPPTTKGGKIRGAPDLFDTQEKQEAFAQQVRQLVDEGIGGRYWYEDSARGVLQVTANPDGTPNLVDAERLIQLLAIYSPQTSVFPNTMAAVRGYIQWKNGASKADYYVNGARDDKALTVLYDNGTWVDRDGNDARKTSSFYLNMMHLIVQDFDFDETSKLIPPDVMAEINRAVTVDLWILRGMGYLRAVAGDDKGAGKYSFAENSLRREAAQRNAGLAPGEEEWLPHQVQAAMWTGTKARFEQADVKRAANEQSVREGHSFKDGKKFRRKPGKQHAVAHLAIWREHAMAASHNDTLKQAQSAKFSFGDALGRMVNTVTWEAVPSSTFGNSILDADPAVKRRFTREARELLVDEDGFDQIAAQLGLAINWTVPGDGLFEGVINPNEITSLLPNKEAGAFDRAKADLYASALQYIFKQDGVPWFRADAHHRFAKGDTDFRVVKNGRTVKNGKHMSFSDAREQAAGIEGATVVGSPFSRGALVTYPEFISDENLDRLRSDLSALLGEEVGFTRISPTEVAIVNFRGEDGLPFLVDDDAFFEAIQKLGEGNDEFGSIGEFRAEGNYLGHDWEADPEGEGVLDRFSGPELGAVQWLRDRRREFEKIVDRYEGSSLEARAAEVAVEGFGYGTEEETNALAALGFTRARNAFEVGTGQPGRAVPALNLSDTQYKNQHMLRIETARRRQRSLLEQPPTEGPQSRAFVGISDTDLFIQLGDASDLSSFLHEMSHIGFNILERMSLREGAPDQVRADWQTLKAWGGTRDATWERIAGQVRAKREQEGAELEGESFEEEVFQEKLSFGFEAYLTTAEAPSRELQAAWSKIKGWMMNVYVNWRQYFGVDSRPPEEVRFVFDRMLATEQQIQELQRQPEFQNGLDAVPRSDLEEVMSQKEIDAHRETTEQAILDGKEAALAASLEEMRGLQQAVIDERREEIAEVVEAEFRSDPMIQLQEWLATGKWISALEMPPALAAIKPGKLDRTALPEGNTVPNRYQRKPGKNVEVYSPEEIAPLWGLSADQLVGALERRGAEDVYWSPVKGAFVAKGPSLKDWVRVETDKRLKAEVGHEDKAADQRATDIMDAAHNDTRGIAIQTELRAMRALEAREPLRQGAQRLVGLEGPQTAQMRREAIEAAREKLKTALAAKDEQGAPRGSEDAIAADAAVQEAVQELRAAEELREAAVAARRIEARGLKAARTVDAEIAALRAQARQTIQQTPFTDLRPSGFATAARRAVLAYGRAVARGDRATAADAKSRHLLHHFQYIEARNARELADRQTRNAFRLTKPPAQRRIGLRSQEHRSQINNLLIRFGFMGQAQAENLGVNLQQFAEEEATGGDVVLQLPDSLAQRPKNYWRQLTPQELTGLSDTLKNIEHLAKNLGDEARMLDGQTFAETKAQMLIRAEEAHPRENRLARRLNPTPGSKVLPWNQKARNGAEKYRALLSKMEFVTETLDGEVSGPWHSALMEVMNEAENMRNRLSLEAGDRTNTAWQEAYPVEGKTDLEGRRTRANLMRQDIQVDELGGEMFSKMELIVLAMNQGAEDNQTKTLNRVMDNGENWTQEGVDAALTNNLSEKDWRLASNLLAVEEWLGVFLFDLEEEVVGVRPPKIEGQPLQTPFGEMPGGYHHIEYDQMLTHNLHLLKDSSILPQATLNARTPQGAAIRRVNVTDKPILLTMGVFSDHLTEVILDVSHRKAIRQVAKFLKDKDIARTIEEVGGRAMRDEMAMWLNRVATEGRRAQTSVFDNMFRNVRYGFTISTMALKTTVALMQPLGYTISTHRLQQGGNRGLHYAAVGLRSYFHRHGTDAESMQRMEDFIFERSVFMESRGKNFDRDIRDIQNRNTSGQLFPEKQEAYFWMIRYMDMAVSKATWSAAYAQSMDGEAHNRNAGDEKAAIAYADMMVRTSQGNAAPKDLSSLQDGSELEKQFSLFYSYWSVVANNYFAASGAGSLSQQARRHVTPRMFGVMMAGFILPQAMSEVLLMRAPGLGGYPEDWDDYLIKQALRLFSAPFVGINLAAESLVAALSGFGGGGTAVQSTFDAAASMVAQGNTLKDGGSARFWRSAFLVGGVALKAPGAQSYVTSEAIVQWLRGKDRYPTDLLIMRGGRER